MRRAELSITTDASGAGTAITRAPISGEIVEVYVFGSAVAGSITVTRDDGGTICHVANPGTLFAWPRPASTGYVTAVIASGGDKKSDTVHIYYDD